jgi:hypothetical protein
MMHKIAAPFHLHTSPVIMSSKNAALKRENDTESTANV